MKNLLLFILLMVGIIYHATAQFDQRIEQVTIITKDGQLIKGIFIEMNRTEVTYLLNGKKHTVKRTDIEKLEINNVIYQNKIDDENNRNNNDQYLLFPSALPAGKGNHYYRNYNFFVHQITFGISDNFTLSGGFESVSFFVDEGFPVLFFTPKFSFGKENLNFSASTTLFINEGDYVGLINGVTTIGDHKNNISFGFVLGYNEIGFEDNFGISLGGLVSLSDKVSLQAESIIIREFGALVSDIGIRYVTNSGIAIDVSLMQLEDIDILIPVLAISCPIRKK